MESAIGAIALLKALGIDTGRIIEAGFIFFIFFAFTMYLGFKYVGPWVKSLLAKADEATSSVATMSKSVDSLNRTLREYMIQTDMRMAEGEEKFRKISEEIKMNMESSEKKFEEVNKQIRYLTTTLQLKQPSKDD